MNGLGMDNFAVWPICVEFLELYGDIDSAVQVLEKQWLFIEKYFTSGGWALEMFGSVASAGSARLLVSGFQMPVHLIFLLLMNCCVWAGHG